MAGYNDTKAMIISTLMGRPAGTEIQPENQQAYELNMLDYIRSLELISSSPIIGVADETTTPVQPDNARVSYIAGVAQNRTVTFQNFIGQNGQPLSITTSDMEAYLVILLWNAQYWTMQAIPTNIISSAENANFYYNYNIRKTYASVAAMNADSVNPIGIDGKPIKLGDIVSVVNTNNSAENGFYSRIEGGWQFQSSLNITISQDSGLDPNVVMSQMAVGIQIRNNFYRLFDYLLTNENLIDSSAIENDKYINDSTGLVNKTVSSPWDGCAVSGLLDVKEAETYKLYSIPSNTWFYSAWFYDSQGNPISKSSGLTSNGSIIPTNAKFIRICWLKSSGTGWNIDTIKNSYVLRNIKLPAPTIYVPYNTFYIQDDVYKQSEYIKSIATDVATALTEPLFGDFSKYFVTDGLNLFNWKTAIRGYYISYGTTAGIGNITASSNPLNGAISDFIPVKPNTTYTINFAITSGDKVVAFYDKDKKALHDGVILGSTTTTTTTTTTADTAYIVVSFGVAAISDAQLQGLQVQEGESVVLNAFYKEFPDYIKKPTTGDTYLDTYLDTCLDTKNYASYVKKIGKNLFDKNNIIEGYYIGSTPGTLLRSSVSAISSLIPIEEGETYAIYRQYSSSGNIATRCVRFLPEDGVTPMKPINPATGAEYANYEVGTSNGTTLVTAPAGAKYIQMTLEFNSIWYNLDALQIEKGNSYTGYEPYEERYIIDYPNLPSDLNGLSQRVSKLEESSNIDTITIENSDKIGFFSNSFLNGYCMLGKHAINNLSMFSDYIMYNYGHSGDDLLELLTRINANQAWLGDVPVQSWNIKYGVIAMQDNDGALYAAASDTYYENGKKLANAIKAMGGIPILGSEHDTSYYYYNFVRLAQDFGYMFMNWGRTAARLFNRVFPPFWNNSHPATRTGWMWTYGMKTYLDTLPRPNKSMKLFRVRPSVDTTDLQNLMYEDILGRAERFIELTCGVSGLTEATEKFFDRLDSGSTAYQTYKDEYQMLQAKSASVSFGDYALIDVITPYDRNNITGLTLNITASGITNAYVRKINSLTNPLPDRRFIAFGVVSGESILTPGTQFQITGGVFSDTLLGTYTVEDVVNGVVVTTTTSSGKTTSGTDNPTTNLSGVVLKGSYDYPSADYMNRYNKPLGEWVEVTIQNNSLVLDSFLNTCMDFDKIGILLKGSSISISDISCEVTGNIKKNVVKYPLYLEKRGTSVINKTTFNDADTEWIGLSDLDKYIPVVSTVSSTAESLPVGITTVRKMNEGQSVKQALTTSSITPMDYAPATLQIKVVARYFPEYIDNDSKWASSPIRRGSFDCAKLDVKIAQSTSDANPAKVGVITVGAWWNEFIINTPYFSGTHIILESENNDIQIAQCDVVLLSE